MFLKEPNGTYEARGKDGTNPHHLFVLAKATKELGVHALVGVRAQDGLIWAGVVCVWVIGPVLKIRALVVAGEDWASYYSSRCHRLGLYEH